MWSVDMAFPPFARPSSWVGCWGQGGKMMDIEYLVTIMADLTSETWYELANDAPPAIMQCFTEQESMLFLPRYQKNAIWALGVFGCTCPGTWWKTVL